MTNTPSASLETIVRSDAPATSYKSISRVIGMLPASRQASSEQLDHRQQIHHIVRRMAFGAPPEHLARFLEIGPEQTIQELLDFASVPNDNAPDGAELEGSIGPGPDGSDHGTAAPQLIFGGSVAGGYYGDLPNLTNLDENGNLRYSVDFRSVYATILERWIETEHAPILGDIFETLDFLK